MSNLEALLLGVVQGLTEFLPISSSGHLIIVPWLQDYTFLTDNDSFNKTFDVALHAGTLIAAIAFFRLEVWRLHRRFIGVAAHAAPIADQRRAPRRRDRDRHDPGGDRRRPRLRLHRRTPRRALDDRDPADLLRRPARLGRSPAASSGPWTGSKVRDGLWIGLAQVLALAPGTSRSGITITAARFLGLDRDAAARFSFLLLIPIVAGATLFKGISAVNEGLPRRRRRADGRRRPRLGDLRLLRRSSSSCDWSARPPTGPSSSTATPPGSPCPDRDRHGPPPGDLLSPLRHDPPDGAGRGAGVSIGLNKPSEPRSARNLRLTDL